MSGPQAAKPQFKDYRKLVKWLTARMMRTAMARGLAVDADDVHQEVCLIWMRCADLYEPEHGKFSNYFARSAFLAFNQGHIVRRVIGHQPEGGLVSLNGHIREQGEEFDAELGDLLADEGMEDPEERLIRKDEAREELKANPVLGRLVEITTAAPPEFMAQLAALKAQQEYAAKLGLPVRESLPTALTPDLVRKILRFNWRQRKLAIEGVMA